uniref:hypothetical protein n=1 Tax=Vogesella mureinivorans TaxID=657276 RepID=UPI0011C8C12B
MNTEHTKHPCETVDASADVMKLAEMILSDCGCSTAISDRLQRRVAGRIQQHMDSALGGQQAEPDRQEFTVASPDVIEFLRALQVRHHDPRREDDSVLGRIGLKASCLLANMSSQPAVAQPPAVAVP